MATKTYSAVSTTESLSESGIQSASTSVAAFVGITESGPTLVPTLISSWDEYQRQFGSLVWYAMVPWAVDSFFKEGGKSCYVVRTPDANRTTAATVQVSSLTLFAATPGTWGNALCAMLSNSGLGSTDQTTETPTFSVSILANASIVDGAAELPNLLIQQYVLKNNLIARTFNGQSYYLLEHFDGFTAESLASDASQCSVLGKTINAVSMFVRVPTNVSATIGARPENAGPIKFDGGSLSYYDFSAGLEQLRSVRDLSLLSMPDFPTATDKSGNGSLELHAQLIDATSLFCEQMGNLFYVGDPPLMLDVPNIVSFKSGQGVAPTGNPIALNASSAAIYYPWLYVFNSTVGQNVPIPPSGPALGRYVNADSSVGVWQSAAGVNFGVLNSIAPDRMISDQEQDLLSQAGINAVRQFANYGTVLWGARTLSSNSDWTYIAVRRLVIYVEQSLKQSLQWTIFEANNQQLWATVTHAVDTFLTSIWQRGGLFGATASQAFFVTCNESNNPVETQSLGQLNIDIGLAPVHPAEFLVLRVTQKTATPDELQLTKALNASL